VNAWLWELYVFVLCQRLFELWLARRNRIWMKSQGGYEVGQEHYKWIVTMHVGFLATLLIEGIQSRPPTLWSWLFLLFVLVQFLRLWVIASLGPYWNTRIWVVPGHPLVKKGPYRYLKHPNYLIVASELLLLPLLFGAYLTAVIFSLLNAWFLLSIRIPQEESAWKKLDTSNDQGLR
jgi:methyltransferase